MLDFEKIAQDAYYDEMYKIAGALNINRPNVPALKPLPKVGRSTMPTPAPRVPIAKKYRPTSGSGMVNSIRTGKLG